MKETLYNKKGIPLMAFGEKTIVTTFGKPKKIKSETPDWTFQVGNTEYVCWGDSNAYTKEANDIIGTVGVLSTGIDYRCRTCIGSGVVPVEITGIDEKLQETYKPMQDMELINYLRGYSFRRYHTEALRDLFKFGNTFPLLRFNNDQSKIVDVMTVNARHCRISRDKTKLLVYADFEKGIPSQEDCVVYDMLNEESPFIDLQWRKETGRLKNKKAIAFPRIKNYFSNNDYYALPQWDTVLEAGWIDVYKMVPKFLEHMYRNAMTLMWHIQIPYEYWEEEFPEENYSEENEEQRRLDITKRMREIEDNLCGVQNANKAFLNTYRPDEAGKIENKVIIEKIDNSLKAEEKLATSAAANSEILFSLMINPAVFGAGMPGNSYAGNAGSGSDIREAFMTSLILNHTERHSVLDPVEAMMFYNGYKNADIKYRDILLTTLNTGGSTTEQIQ